MLKLDVKLGARSYPIHITSDYAKIADCIKERTEYKRIVIITDSNVDKFYCQEVASSLRNNGYEVEKYVLDAGEKSKSLNTVSDIYQYLLDLKVDRESMLLALGGGMVGDITGFVAASFLRGIKFIQVPTSLLAQVDSSVGGKVGVNFQGIKNAIGSFYQPLLVYTNVNSLKTLPVNELKSGLTDYESKL
ncbi:MAG TPA: 3-dehydroquinate synthase family protein, partial [Clostridia bacterium]|nr:3-dehydroquinate synthase family protein [Clostridia bacterium]